jgi:hypothetical protein
MWLVNFFTSRKKGCLHGKNPQQKEAFFDSLSKFALSDTEFFKEQVNDLQPHEKKEFLEYVQNKNQVLKAIKSMLTVIENLTPPNQK